MTLLRDEITYELEIWPPGAKTAFRSGNVGLGTYRTMREVAAAMKRINRAYSRKPVFRVWFVTTTRTTIPAEMLLRGGEWAKRRRAHQRRTRK